MGLEGGGGRRCGLKDDELGINENCGGGAPPSRWGEGERVFSKNIDIYILTIELIKIIYIKT